MSNQQNDAINEHINEWYSMNDLRLLESIELELLDMAGLYNTCTQSDLQGVAWAKAIKILSMVNKAKGAS